MFCFKILLILLVVGGLLSNIVLADTTSTLRPTADGGDDSDDWKNTSNSACDTVDCYTEVNESSGSSCTNSDGDASYVQGDVNGANQTFDIDESSIPDNSTITQIDITVCYKSGSPGADTNDFQTRYCAGSLCSNSGANIATGVSYTETTQSHSGLSITKTASTDLEVGMAITEAEGEPVRISQISAVITHTPPAAEVPTPTPGAAPITHPERYKFAPGRIQFTGVSYPGSTMEILQRTKYNTSYQPVPDSAMTILSDGSFDILVGGLAKTEHFLSLRAIDKNERKSTALLFSANLSVADELVVKEISIPPTVEIAETVVTKGDLLKIEGYAPRYHTIESKIDEEKSGGTETDISGSYTLSLPTESLDIGTHYIKTRQRAQSGIAGMFSTSLAFKVSALIFPRADFNQDNMVNIFDWSIFLLRWGSQDVELRQGIDLDKSGQVDIADFSIFLTAMEI